MLTNGVLLIKLMILSLFACGNADTGKIFLSPPCTAAPLSVIRLDTLIESNLGLSNIYIDKAYTHIDGFEMLPAILKNTAQHIPHMFHKICFALIHGYSKIVCVIRSGLVTLAIHIKSCPADCCNIHTDIAIAIDNCIKIAPSKSTCQEVVKAYASFFPKTIAKNIISKTLIQ